MANATATESSLFNHSFDDLDIVEFSNIDDSILMSLLEDSPMEEYGDDERLRIVIQSLEAEIINQDSCLETYRSDQDNGFSDIEQLDSCSTSPDNHLGFEWVDMEMDYGSPNDKISSYYIGHLTDNMGTMDDHSLQVCFGMPVEEENYSGLWQ